MPETAANPRLACRHPDIQKFDDLRCCLSCGEAVLELPEEQHHVSSDHGRSEYQYRRLNYALGQEIRLLRLHAGAGIDAITCSIVHTNLDDKPAFEAVSYTWADATGDASLS
jgi:hypothetical protein